MEYGLAATTLDLLSARGATLASAESLTGGQLAAQITAVPGASRSFLGGVVSYATQVKVSVLGVPQSVVDECGVISGECAEAMARGAVRLVGATHAVSTTGVAGPDLQEGQSVGTVFVAVAHPGGVETRRLALSGDRATIQVSAVQEALVLLIDVLRREELGLG